MSRGMIISAVALLLVLILVIALVQSCHSDTPDTPVDEAEAEIGAVHRPGALEAVHLRAA